MDFPLVRGSFCFALFFRFSSSHHLSEPAHAPQPMGNFDKTPEESLSTSFKTFSVMDKKGRIRQQLRSCAEQMQQLVDQLNPNHEISRSLQNSITRIQLFNEYDQPNVLSLWQDLLHEPQALPFRGEEFSRREESKSLLDRRAEHYPGIPILFVDTDISRGGGLPAVQRKVEAHDIMDEFHHAPLMLSMARKRNNDDDDELAQPFDECEEGLLGADKKFEAHNIIDKVDWPARKWKVVRKRKNDDYDADDELNQPDMKRPKPSKTQGHRCL